MPQNKSGVSDQIISLPKGGGALKSLGEKFSPDLYTGTGNFSIPIAIPSGRNSFQPQLSLNYSSGSGNGAFGLGWNIGIPSVSRKTSKGIPKYRDRFFDEHGSPIWSNEEDVFILSGAEDLVYVGDGMYRPRTEGLFARIRRIRGSDGQPYWEVKTKDGITSKYGSTSDSRLYIYDRESNTSKIYQWFLAETRDTFGNLVVYKYKRDIGSDLDELHLQLDLANYPEERNHEYNQLYLQSIEYVNYQESATGSEEKFLWKIEFDYGEFDDNGDKAVKTWEIRPDRFSAFNAGFEIRTARRCKRILIKGRLSENSKQIPDVYELIKSYALNYVQDEFTDISLLREVILTGYKDKTTDSFPPIYLDYTKFEPQKRKYETFSAEHDYLPERSLGDPNYEIIDLFGNGLPCIIHSSPSATGGWRYWRNLGNLHFKFPKSMKNSPAAGVLLADKGVQFADLNGDGSVELLITRQAENQGDNFSVPGYYTKNISNGEWSKFYPFSQLPTFDLEDSNVKLLDLDGNGVIDVLYTASEHHFLFIQNINHSNELRFDKPVAIERKHNLDEWPDVYLASPDQRVRLADMSGDGLQDIVLIHSGRIDYWPSLGYGKFGKRITMFNSPRFANNNQSNFDPKRLFFTDVNGDGLADLVYVDFKKVSLWINQSGNRWSKEVIISGTPSITNLDSIRIADMNGTGTTGILWSYDYSSSYLSESSNIRKGPRNYKFLDFTGGIKPLLLNGIDNNIGAKTEIEYRPSTYFYLKDQFERYNPWKTNLPFPVQVVSRVETIDLISNGKLSTEYIYHHGHWDGLEREFCGFGRVDQRDTETFEDFNMKNNNSPGLAAPLSSRSAILEDDTFNKIPTEFYSPPTEIRTWFHQGSVKNDSGMWTEIDHQDEFWSGDPSSLFRPKEMVIFLSSLSPQMKHNVLRTLRGRKIRTELYALDGTKLQHRPYIITEYLHGIMTMPIGHSWPPRSNKRHEDDNEEEEWRQKVFFPYSLGERTTRWERGNDPMSNFQFTGRYTKYGQPQSQISIAVPRHKNSREITVSQKEGEIHAPYLTTLTLTRYALRDDAYKYIVNRVSMASTYEIINDGGMAVYDLRNSIEEGKDIASSHRVIDQIMNFYDGEPFLGLPIGQIGNYGALVRTEKLILTREILEKVYNNDGNNGTFYVPPYLLALDNNPPQWTEDYPEDFQKSLAPLAGYNFKDRRGIHYSFARKWGFSGNREGEFNHPSDIAVDNRTGNLYVTDTGNGRIQKFDSKGNFIQTIIAGLDIPIGIALDPNTGEIYVGEPTANRIKKFSSSGAFLTMWGKQGTGDGEFNGLWGGIGVDSSGSVYVTDWGNDRIQKFSSSGAFLTMWGKQGTGDGEFRNPTGVAFDSSGHVYVTDGNALQKFSSSGAFIKRTYRRDPKPPWGISIDGSDNVYETYNYNHKVQKWNSDGSSLVFSWGDSGSGDGQFGNARIGNAGLGPHGIGINHSTGEVYVVDTANNHIQVFAPENEEGYFTVSERRQYDFHVHPDGKGRGIPTIKRDALGRDTSIKYDDYEFLPIKAVNPAGLITEALYDYQALQPKLVTDPNLNRTQYSYSPLGFLKSIAVMGKEGEEEGDTPDHPSTIHQYDFLVFTKRIEKGDVINNKRQQPIFVHTFKREQHFWDVIHEENERRLREGRPFLTEAEIRNMFPEEGEVGKFPDRFIQSRDYSDGFGRILQTRTQAEDITFGDPVFGNSVLPADQSKKDETMKDVVGRKRKEDGTDPPKVVVSGWQVYDNKGHVVIKYEPFFSTDWKYEESTTEEYLQNSLKVIMYYDPRGHVIRTVNPDGSEQRVVYGVPGTILAPDLTNLEVFEPTPWESYIYDANDNGERTHKKQSEEEKYQTHWNTPSSTVVDALGRTVKSIMRNGSNPVADWYTTTSAYDLRGNLLTVTDALNRVAFRYFYDLANRPIQTENIDSGAKRTVLDATGNKIESRDGKDALILNAYDVLNRPIRMWARDDHNNKKQDSVVTLREQIEYGDRSDKNQPADEREPNERQRLNLLGKVHKHYDEAGLISFIPDPGIPGSKPYDFKGNVLEKVRQVIKDDQIIGVFEQAAEDDNWQVKPYRVKRQPVSDALLDDAQYRTSTKYDALNRIRSMQYPEDVDHERKVLRPQYNHAGAMESVELDDGAYVKHIAYNAKGQRTLVLYGNNVMTRYAYNENTLRLARMRSERYNEKTITSSQPIYRPMGDASQGFLFQDFCYKYDLVGNIIEIYDRTPKSGISNSPSGMDALDRVFTYDPVYRLLSATGRECSYDLLNELPPPWMDKPKCTDPTLTRAYTQEYQYDSVGNMESLKHYIVENGTERGFTRKFTLAQDGENAQKTNRLSTLTVGDKTRYSYTYDKSGNLIEEGALRHFEWDHSDRMQAFYTKSGDGAPTDYTHYLYDSSGQRVKKLVGISDSLYRATVYIDGVFEYHRLVRPSNNIVENNILHIMDDQSRVALVRVGHAYPDDGPPEKKVKYHLGDHLGSSNVVIDEIGNFVNREEYYPYGETSFGSFARKGYRFSGKERDEESELCYHCARYYAPWLGRWISCDPIDIDGGINLYEFANDNPVRFVDNRGKQANSIDDLLTFLHAQSGFEAGANRPLSFDPRSAGPSGTAAHGRATSVLSEMKNIGFLGSEGIYSEVRVVNGIVTQIGGTPGGPKGAHNLDIAVTKASKTLQVGQDISGGYLERIGDLKYGGGTINPKYATHGSPLQTITGRTQASTSAAIESTSGASIVAKGQKLAQVESLSSRWSSLSNAAAGAAAKGAKLLGQIATVTGAYNEAVATYNLEIQNNRGELNASLMFLSTAAVGILAGAVDDALAAATLNIGSAPVIQSWEDVGAGPTQHLGGELIRGFLEWGAQNGL